MSIKYNKGATQVGDVEMGEAMHVGGQGAYEKSLYLPLGFAVNLKLL